MKLPLVIFLKHIIRESFNVVWVCAMVECWRASKEGSKLKHKRCIKRERRLKILGFILVRA